MIALTTTGQTRDADQRPYRITEEREPCADYTPQRRAYFGDFHVHTAWSFDASAQDTRNTPDDAYRFARGERIQIQPYSDEDIGERQIQIDRPLDFTAVTDHAEFLGEMRLCNRPGSPGYWHPTCALHRHMPSMSFLTFGAYGMNMKKRWNLCDEDDTQCKAAAGDTWRDIQRAAEAAYDRSSNCEFTSFIGYEWTANIGAGLNLHHNVIFRNEQVPDHALSWLESPTQVDLWDYLDAECIDALDACDAVVIPHNSNLSGSLMFKSARISATRVPDAPDSVDDATRRARWHRLFELVQHKGASECDSRSAVWGADEFCDFELLDYDTFGGKNTGASASAPIRLVTRFVPDEDKPVTRLPDETNFLRHALKKGLQQQADLGVNSFQYGVIGSTDTHIAAPGLVVEQGFPGHGGAGIAAGEGVPEGLVDDLEYGPGGLAVLYAEENSRDALFEAMLRREAYATSGTRPQLRFFGGWDYDDNLCQSADLVSQGYAAGVPMGGTLPPLPEGSAQPRFIVQATQDPGTKSSPGTPLQRLQIIKGWYRDGDLHERVLDIAGGDNTSSVDLNTCERRGEGHQQLCRVWQDNNFQPTDQAFYYVRLLENPSCRWSQYSCIQAGVDCEDPSTMLPGLEGCCAAEHKPVIQERAWSSPIWYIPKQ
ncbi:MAG: DUF3604 domain-containing protein [Pseudomonadota bacterium]